MILRRQREPLALDDVPVPDPRKGELLIRIEACAVCRTDLHIVEGELPRRREPWLVVAQRFSKDHGDALPVPPLAFSFDLCSHNRKNSLHPSTAGKTFDSRRAFVYLTIVSIAFF